MIPIEDALNTLLTDVATITDTEIVALKDAQRRVLATAVHSTINVPPADVSAMDGYAVAYDNIKTLTAYPVSQRIAAGHSARELDPQTIARIFTGSVVPPNADTVIIQEDAIVNADASVSFKELPARGSNIRKRGQDIVAGAEILSLGHCLRAQDLGVIASVGIGSVDCYRSLRVGVLSSGDELTEPGQVLGPGKIYNSNRYTLLGLIHSLGMTFVDLGHVEDNLMATQSALRDAVDKVDIILTTGGVSVGEEDHIKRAVESLGQLQLWKLAIKPGKPLAYGKIQKRPFFGLPGNPVAVFVTFLMVVRPYLQKMQGQILSDNGAIKIPCNFSVTNPSPRQEYRRVRMHKGTISEYHTQDSGVLTSTHWANALAVIPANTTVTSGDLLDVYPFSLFNL